MEKKSKIKKIKYIIIICIILSILLIFFIFRNQIGNIIFNIQMIGVNKDIKIQELGGNSSDGGYASTSYDYYIDLSKKKIYKIEDYFVYGVTFSQGKKGDHYKLKKTKKLSEEEINEILKLTNLESDYNSSETNMILSNLDKATYYTITYNQKTIKLTKSTANIISNIITNMK